MAFYSGPSEHTLLSLIVLIWSSGPLFFLISALPDVGLELNERTYRVGDSIQAQCLGSANPPISRYAWYMGEQLLDGENESDLTLKGAAGQHLNGESVKCVAFNEVGNATSFKLLNVECEFFFL